MDRLDKTFDRLWVEIAGLRQEMGGFRQEMRQEMGGLRHDVRQDIAALRGDLSAFQGRMVNVLLGLVVALIGAVTGLVATGL